MKKIIGVFTAIALGSIMFAGPFGDLAKTIEKASSAPVSDVLEGTIPEGKELGVYLWKMEKQLQTLWITPQNPSQSVSRTLEKALPLIFLI